MVYLDETAEQRQQRGQEPQAEMSEPLVRGPRFLRKRAEISEGREVVDGTRDLVILSGVLGFVLAVPGIVIHLWRRSRRLGR